MDDKNYLDVIVSICKENNIKAVLSLIDPELSLLSKIKRNFRGWNNSYYIRL